jgi:hypothetical protein
MIRTSNLSLLAGTALLVIWYFTGGPAQFRWWWTVHQAARGGWDISQAYNGETMKPRFWLPVSLFSGSLLVFGVVAVKIRDTVRILKDIQHG